MNTEKIVKESKVILVTTLIIGVALLALGVTFSLLELKLVPNNKALIGLSFIPLSIALIYWVKLLKIKRSPEKMKAIIVNENDERLVALKNEADAKAFRILQGLLFLSYMGYTFMVPADIFESLGWWLLLILMFSSFIFQGIMIKIVSGKDNS